MPSSNGRVGAPGLIECVENSCTLRWFSGPGSHVLWQYDEIFNKASACDVSCGVSFSCGFSTGGLDDSYAQRPPAPEGFDAEWHDATNRASRKWKWTLRRHSAPIDIEKWWA